MKMNREQIIEKITHSLQDAGLGVTEVRVQPDPFSGWRIAVVSEGYKGKPFSERKKLTLAGLHEEHIEWIDLLTPEEREWAGSLPLDTGLDDVPLWAETLARGQTIKHSIVFPSDLDVDPAAPIVSTFYSLRGGVGRSTALAYTACILAARGLKVVCMDMDLEAPGLAALFGLENKVQALHGIVQLLLQYDQGEDPDPSMHLIRVDEASDLYLIPSGKIDADYARKLRFIDPSAWYREDRNPLRLLLHGLENRLPFKPDVLLLDARTGITPLSGPLLFDLADIAVITFFPHPQTQVGTGYLVRGLLSARTRRSQRGQDLTPEPRFLISPLPASKAPEVSKRYEHRALEWISEWIEPANQVRGDQEPLLEDEISHFVRYREDLATSDIILRESEIWRSYEKIAEWIERFLPTRQERYAIANLAIVKNTVLNELSFAPGTAEQQAHLLETFVETDMVRGAIEASIPLILGRKGSGKTAIFRRLSESQDKPAIVVQSPASLRGPHQWMLSIDGFRSVDEDVLANTEADWRQFWCFYTCTAINHFLKDKVDVEIPSGLKKTMEKLPMNESNVVSAFEAVARTSRFGLMLNEWLANVDTAVGNETLILLDGLDTGFGNSERDRERRKSALEGLFEFWTDRGSVLKNLRFKILLREDIWRKLNFENKSHLFGRSITLKWNKQADYCKVVLKQAARAKSFSELLQSLSSGTRLEEIDLNTWSEREVFGAWNLLVGERMKGGKTAFTRNWVWNRLADGNEDHTPRYLLQLFHEVVPWEKSEHDRNPYDRSIIRPRALISCLSTVSKEALGALIEEFSELESLFDRLRSIGRTPLPASDLKDMGAEVALASEVGLLAIYEGTEEQVDRYKVPDIYRLGLVMTRKGQA